MTEKRKVIAENEESKKSGEKILQEDIQKAMLYSAVITVVTLASSLIVVVSSGSEARLLLSAMLPSIQFLSSAVMTAAATTLALLLALVGFGNGTDSQLRGLHYDRVEQIARWNLIVFIAAGSLLLFISIPLSESQEVPANWYKILYYFVLFYSGALTGVLTFVIILLYRAIKSIINVLHPDRRSDLVIETDGESHIELPRST